MKANAKWIPIVLTAASAVGVVGTAVLTAKCTTKAEKMLAGRRENDGNTKETVIDICRCYAPAIACGSITVACIVYNGILHLSAAESACRGLYARQREPHAVSVKG